MKKPQVAHHSYTSPARRVRRVWRLRRRPLPALLRFLAEKLRLQREDVVEHAIDAASLEPVLGYDARVLERSSQRRAQRSIHAHLAAHLRLLEDLQAMVQRQLAQPVLSPAAHTPSTSTRPSRTRTCTTSSDGSLYVPIDDPCTVNARLWHGHTSECCDESHHSSHGRSEQIDQTADTLSPLRVTNAPTAPAFTMRASPGTKSATEPTSTQRPFVGRTTWPAVAPGWLPLPSSDRPSRPPPTAPATTPSPATSAARRVIQDSGGVAWSCFTSRCRNAGLIRCGPPRAAARRAAMTIASFSSASPPRSFRRRPRSRPLTMRSTRLSGRSPIEAHLRRRAQRTQLHDLHCSDRGAHLSRHFFEGIPVQETQLQDAAVIVRKLLQT